MAEGAVLTPVTKGMERRMEEEMALMAPSSSEGFLSSATRSADPVSAYRWTAAEISSEAWKATPAQRVFSLSADLPEYIRNDSNTMAAKTRGRGHAARKTDLFLSPDLFFP